MAQKKVTGTVVTVMDNVNQKNIVVEIEPAVTPKKAGDKPIPRKQIQIATNVHDLLDGLKSGSTVTITIS